MLPFFMAEGITIKVNGTLVTNNYQNDQKLDPLAEVKTFYKTSDGEIVQKGAEAQAKPQAPKAPKKAG